jgi:predicted acyl esterase
MSTEQPSQEGVLRYKASGHIEEDAKARKKPGGDFRGHARPEDTLTARPELLQFSTAAFAENTEITGHVSAHLNLSASKTDDSTQSPSEIDVFVTLRYVDPDGGEVFYTGTAGDPVPLTKGWLRCSMRKVSTDSPYNKPWMPHREYRREDVQPVEVGKVYEMDIEIWPTCCVVEKGGKLVFESK